MITFYLPNTTLYRLEVVRLDLKTSMIISIHPLALHQVFQVQLHHHRSRLRLPREKKAEKRKIGRTELDGFDDLLTMMSSVVNTCKQLTTVSPATKSPTSNVSNRTVPIEDLPLDDLYKLIEQHRKHLDFLKENDMCDTEKTKSIVNKCEMVFDIINSRTSTQPNSVSNK